TGRPGAYDAVVGEQGLTLSAGQRQRIAIARALYRDPRLVIFDEATSALDGPSERAVEANLQGALAERTTLLIAHRLASVRNADLILVLHDGVIAEEGKHEELLRREGVYYELAARHLPL